MTLDDATLRDLTRRVFPADYLRSTPIAYRSTPLGMGYGQTRFASPAHRFTLVYIAEALATAIAETIVRDRFEGLMDRALMESDVSWWGACEVSANADLRVFDLRGDGCFRLGISTDIVGAKAHDEARAFSHHLYESTDLDGIIYHSRLRRKNCLAAYDRSVSKLVAEPVMELPRLAALVPALRKLRVKLIA